MVMQLDQYEQYQSASKLEEYLGDFYNNKNIISVLKILDCDKFSIFPEKQAAYLHHFDIGNYFIPIELGGKLKSFEELVLVWRSIFRRDATLGLGLGVTTFMASVAGIYFGNEIIKKFIIHNIQNNLLIAVAYNEEDHGNDILQSEVTATINQNAIIISGKKWLINNAQKAAGLTVFCKTHPLGGPRGFTLAYIDKSQINLSSLDYGQKIKTVGVKGCNLTSIAFNQTKAPLFSIISQPSNGFDITLKSFQITKAILPGMAIGIGDTALRSVFNFAKKRILYSKTIISYPHVSEVLTDSYINLLVCDCVSTMVVRALHVIPAEMSMLSAYSKYYIPKKIQNILNELSIVLGARNYIVDGEYGIFQKIIRDFPVISLGHGGEWVCATSIFIQLKSILLQTKNSYNANILVKKIFNLKEVLPLFDAHQLSITNNGNDTILNYFKNFQYKQIETKINLNKTISYYLKMAVDQICLNLHCLSNQIQKKSISHVKEFDTFAYQCVEQFSQIYAGICCILCWSNNYGQISAWFDEGIWLVFALKNINSNFICLEKIVENEMRAKILDELTMRINKKLSFSIVSINYQ